MTEEEKKSYNDKMSDLWLMINDLDEYFSENPDPERESVLDKLVKLARTLNNDTMTPSEVQEEANKIRMKIVEKYEL